MNLKKVKKQLNKIKHLVDVLEGEDKVQIIERDLLLDYVRTLYSTIRLEDEQEAIPKVKKAKVSTPIKEEVVPTPKEHTAVVAPPPPPVQEPVVPAPSVPLPPVPAPSPKVSKEIMSLFDDEESSDLSDKLSSMRITDLTKAFSINERIFTVNELFGGDKSKFEATLSYVNGLTDFNKAKQYLSEGVATENDWSTKDKVKKAKKFIQLIRHKFA